MRWLFIFIIFSGIAILYIQQERFHNTEIAIQKWIEEQRRIERCSSLNFTDARKKWAEWLTPWNFFEFIYSKKSQRCLLGFGINLKGDNRSYFKIIDYDTWEQIWYFNNSELYAKRLAEIRKGSE